MGSLARKFIPHAEKAWLIQHYREMIMANEANIKVLSPLVEGYALEQKIASPAGKCIERYQQENARYQKLITEISAISESLPPISDGSDEPRRTTKTPFADTPGFEQKDLGTEARDDSNRSPNESGEDNVGFTVSL